MINLKSMAEEYCDKNKLARRIKNYHSKEWRDSEEYLAYRAGAQAVLEKVRPVLEFYAGMNWASDEVYPSPDKARAMLEELKDG